MLWYKITLTQKQFDEDTISIIQNLVEQSVQIGLIDAKDVGIYSDALRKNLTYGDEKILFLNPKTYQILKDNLADYDGELCNEPDYKNLSSLFPMS